MSATTTPSAAGARTALRRLAASPWLVGALLGAAHFTREAADELRLPVQRFDEGIQLSSGALIAHGELPLRDYYQPYGPGFGLPGAIGRWLFGDGILADRLLYRFVPALRPPPPHGRAPPPR